MACTVGRALRAGRSAGRLMTALPAEPEAQDVPGGGLERDGVAAGVSAGSCAGASVVAGSVAVGAGALPQPTQKKASASSKQMAIRFFINVLLAGKFDTMSERTIASS